MRATGFLFSALAAAVLFAARQSDAGSFPLVFYIPFPEADYLAALQAIETGGGGSAPANPVQTYISLAAIADGTIIRYDHWEDGYEAVGDQETPIQATTLVWGDGNPTNGMPPGFTTDVIRAGSVILLTNQLTTTSPYDIDFDARDRVAANRTISMTRTFWASGSSTLMAGCVEVFDRSLWGTAYKVPIGENIPTAADNDMFQYTGLSVMAGDDGTTVELDLNANGVYETTNSLNKGESVFVNGGVSVGGAVRANKPIQVVMLSGDIASNYESRDSSLLPVDRWSGSYYTPVSTPAGDGTRVWVYNPSTSTSITVYYDYRVGTNALVRSNALTVAANSYDEALLPVNSGAHFYTTNTPVRAFYAYSTTDSDTADTADNQAWDWSYTLFPENLLSPQVVVGLGIGRDPLSGVNPSENGNPVWVTPAGNGETPITVYVDFNGDNLGPYTDPNGFRYDTNYPLKEMQQQKIYDPDGDQSAMLVYVLSTNVTLAAAWGQDPLTATAGAPGLDVGTSIPPEDVIDAGKTLSVVNDTDADGQLGPSDRAEYLITIGNSSRAIIPASLAVQDVLPTNTTYITNSTAYRTNSTSAWIAYPDDGTGTPFPLDGTGVVFSVAVSISNYFYVRFQVDVSAYSNLNGASSIVNTGSVRSIVFNRTITFENETPLHGSIGDRVWHDADGDGTQDVSEVGINGVRVYLDTNTNGVWDAFEPSAITSNDGNYLLDGPYVVAGTHVVRVDTSTLPLGYTATYDLDGTSTVSRATFALAGGEDKRDVDFGYRLPPSPLQIVKTSGVGAATLHTGETNTYTITISNTGLVTQTGIQITDILPDTLRYASTSTVAVGYKGSGVATNTYRDEFGTQAYTNNNGTTNWSGNWIEVGESDGAAAGNVRVDSTYGSYELRLYRINNSAAFSGGAYRQANLTGYTNASLSFLWRRADIEEDVLVQASSSSNSGYSTVFTIPNRNGYTDAAYSNSGAISLNSYTGAPVYLRFYTDMGPAGGSADDVWVDDIQITVVGGSATTALVTNDNTTGAYPDLLDGVPPDMVEAADGFTLATGRSMTVTFRAIVTNALPPGVSAITNTAGVRSDQWPLWIYSSVTNPVDGAYAGAIGDYAWIDANGNGTQDVTEVGLSNVVVRLYDTNNVIVGATTTTVAGAYSFTNLPPGTYTVGFTPPAGYLFTTSNVGSDAADSDPLAGTNRTAAFALAANETNNTVDAGFYLPASIGDYTWVDSNGNGQQDGGEPALSNVVVRLYNTNNVVVATTTSSVAGVYSFTNLPPGTYTVGFTPPAGYQFTTSNVGSDATDSDPSPATGRTGSITLASGQTDNTVDAGFYAPVSIGDFAWTDLNGNGQQDGGEPGLSNVTVRLYDAATNLVGTTKTATNGLYAFTNLPPGIYSVSFTPPPGYLFTTSNVGSDASDSDPLAGTNRTAAYTLASGQTDSTIDAGFYLPGSIGDRVWLDEDSNGLQDTGEAGIPNVKVELVGTGGVVLASRYTDTDGGYLFTGLPAGAYTVRVDSASMPAGLAANPTYDEDGTGTTHRSTVVLAAAEDHVTADFGYNWAPPPDTDNGTGTGAIGDRVWIDADGDGAQDAGEAGFSNILVQLYRDADTNGTYETLVAATNTSADGLYIFDNLAPGAYAVVANGGTAPAGYTQTGDPDYFGEAVPAAERDNRTTTPVVLAPGDVFVNADFGYQPAAGTSGAIGDRVWFDADADGVQDAAEYGIGGVSVALIRDLDADGVWDAGEPIIASMLTDTNGLYQFSGLPVADGTGTDDYLVWVNDTAGVLIGQIPTYDSNGTAPATGLITGYGISASANLAAAGDLSQDFGYTAPNQTTTLGLIGDTIFLDRDADNTADSGEGIEGVVVRLFDGTGTNLLATTTTDENGRYYFGGLSAGTYTVKVDTATLPGTGLVNTYDPDGGAASQSGVTIAAGEVNLLQDFGYRDTANPNAIGGTLWEDRNADGTLTGAEPNRFAGITVILSQTNGSIVGSTTTDSGGNYSFTNLPDGTYRIHVTDGGSLLNGWWKSTGPAPGTDDNSQSDPYTVSVSGGQTNTTGDFGYFLDPASLGNRTWRDADGDGVQDTGEIGLSNVLVKLTISYPNGVTTFVYTVSATNGFYSFGNLMLDEDHSTPGWTGDVSRPLFSISIPAIPAGYYAVPPYATNIWLDSGRLSGTDAFPYRGTNEMQLQADPQTEPVAASLDFGFTPTPTLARLVSFDARVVAGDVIVRWVTAEEIGTAGFWLERLVGDEYVRVNEELIPGQLFSLDGATYEQLDPGARPGHTYTWRLVELEADGDFLYLGPYTLQVGQPALSFDEWSRQYFSDPAAGAPEADPDGDGRSNRQEFGAGTNPADAGSVLRILSIRPGPDGAVEIRWTSEPGKRYQLGLMGVSPDGLLPVADGLNAAPPVNVFTDTVPANESLRFYRIQVEE